MALKPECSSVSTADAQLRVTVSCGQEVRLFEPFLVLRHGATFTEAGFPFRERGGA